MTYAKFGGEEDVVSFSGTSRKPFADEGFVVAINVGGIPESLAFFIGIVEELEALFFAID